MKREKVVCIQVLSDRSGILKITFRTSRSGPDYEHVVTKDHVMTENRGPVGVLCPRLRQMRLRQMTQMTLFELV